MAGPKSFPIAEEQQQQDTQSGTSYKSKLLQASSTDELSVPDQSKGHDEDKPKLAPVKDEGSPPMVPDTEAAGEARHAAVCTAVMCHSLWLRNG
jgi:hypothetical protein